MANQPFLIADSIYCGVIRTHRIDGSTCINRTTANERLTDGLTHGRKSKEVSVRPCSLIIAVLAIRWIWTRLAAVDRTHKSIIVGGDFYLKRKINLHIMLSDEYTKLHHMMCETGF